VKSPRLAALPPSARSNPLPRKDKLRPLLASLTASYLNPFPDDPTRSLASHHAALPSLPAGDFTHLVPHGPAVVADGNPPHCLVLCAARLVGIVVAARSIQSLILPRPVPAQAESWSSCPIVGPAFVWPCSAAVFPCGSPFAIGCGCCALVKKEARLRLACCVARSERPGQSLALPNKNCRSACCATAMTKKVMRRQIRDAFAEQSRGRTVDGSRRSRWPKAPCWDCCGQTVYQARSSNRTENSVR